MDFDSKIFIAGHKGLVGSAIVRKLNSLGYKNILTVDKSVVNLTDVAGVNCFFKIKKPEYVYLYDGPHQYQDQYNALTLGLVALEREFIFICDDWNWDFLREATKKSIEDLGIEVLYTVETITSVEDYEND